MPYGTSLYIDVKDVDIEKLNPTMQIDRFAFYKHEAGFLNLDLDIDSISDAAPFLDFPMRFTLPEMKDCILIIYQFVLNHIRIGMKYISNKHNETKEIAVVDDQGCFREDIDKYIYVGRVPHNSSLEVLADMILVAYQYWTGNEINTLCMFDIDVNHLKSDEYEGEVHYVYMNYLQYFDLVSFDFSGLNMPGLPRN